MTATHTAVSPIKGLIQSDNLCPGLDVHVLGQPQNMRLPELDSHISFLSGDEKARAAYKGVSKLLGSFRVVDCLLPHVSEANAVFERTDRNIFGQEFRDSYGVPLYKNKISIDA